jgi:hypothetical protein
MTTTLNPMMVEHVARLIASDVANVQPSSQSYVDANWRKHSEVAVHIIRHVLRIEQVYPPIQPADQMRDITNRFRVEMKQAADVY